MVDRALMARVAGPVLDRVLGLGESRTAEVRIRTDVAVPMPDGTVLATDLYQPVEVQRGPVVLFRTPYDKSRPLTSVPAIALARRGLQVAVQDVRGTFASGGGEFDPFRYETEDGLATIGWLREQDWCDGRIGTAGASYLGYTQWSIARHAEPPLSAMAIAVSTSDFRPTFYPGGAIGWETLLSWASLIGVQEDPAPFWRNWTRPWEIRAKMSTLPASLGTGNTIGKPVRFLADVLEHGDPDDDYWDYLDHSGQPERLAPTSMVAGWYDIFAAGQLGDFGRLQQAGVPVRITIGPWWHAEPAALKATYVDQIDWLVGRLLDDPVILNRAPVRLYLQGAGRWLDFDSWPVPADDHELALDVDASLRPPAEIAPRQGIRAFVYDPADPTPVLGGATLGTPGGQQDNRRTEARDDVLVYQTEPLDSDLDVIGEPRATIVVRTEHPDADVFVRVCDVDRSGRSLNVVEGLRRLTVRDAVEDDLGTRTVSITLTPTGYRFLAGHRIRVQVCGGAFPNYIRNHQTGDPVADAVATSPGRIQILHGGERPSSITLPVHRR